MRKVIFESSVSLDGFIEGANGDLDWMVFDEIADSVNCLMSAFDTLFYGRKAYERFAISLCRTPDFTDAEKAFYYAFYGMRKYVFSRSRRHVVGNAMVIYKDLEAEVRRIRAEEGKDILFCGGAEIMNALAHLDLIDEYQLTVHPVILKTGKPLFTRNNFLNLCLTHRENMSSGLVILRYIPQSRLKLRLW